MSTHIWVSMMQARTNSNDGRSSSHKFGVGKRLRFVRDAVLHLSANELAKHTGVSKNSVVRYETGESAPDVFYVRKISDLANCNIEWLATGEGPVLASDRPAPDEDDEIAPGVREQAVAGFPKRLSFIVALVGGVADLARLSGIREVELRRFLAREAEPGMRELHRLASTGGVTVEWLVTGKVAAGGKSPEDALLSETFALLPFYDVEVSAGGGAAVENEAVKERLAFHKRWLKQEIGAPARNLVLVTARGDSMAPTIREGAILLVDTGQTALGDDGIYVIRRDHLLSVKRLQRAAGEQVIVKSDNPAYDPITVDADQLAIVGRVVWVGGKI